LPQVPTYSCELPGGARVRYSLKKRPGSPFYFVVFRDGENRRRELTTGEKAKHAAEDAAPVIVLSGFAPGTSRDRVPWDDAIDLMKEHMQAKNLRVGSIQQYELAVGALRKLFPDTEGPADITPAIAEQFKVKRMNAKRMPRTVEGNIDNLSIVFGCWFRDTLHIVETNPFAEVAPPKYDKAPPRVIAPEEQRSLLDWFGKKWDFRLPVLFLEVKASIGCRIGELATAKTEGLRDGRIRFMSETTKGRMERACRLPAELYAELERIAGSKYVFERFSDDLRAAHLRKGAPNHAKAVRDFTPARMVHWIQKEAKAYFKLSKAKRFKLHNFRGTAMSRARMAGVAESDAAIAFGCNPTTMRQHYLALDEARIADEVFAKMATV
jgi:hypothetical protein